MKKIRFRFYIITVFKIKILQEKAVKSSNLSNENCDVTKNCVYVLEIPLYSSFFKESKLQMRLKINPNSKKQIKMINSDENEVDDNSNCLDTIESIVSKRFVFSYLLNRYEKTNKKKYQHR